MMIQEFEKLTGCKVLMKDVYYNIIEPAYTLCDDDKQAFCENWKKYIGKPFHKYIKSQKLIDKQVKAAEREYLSIMISYHCSDEYRASKADGRDWEIKKIEDFFKYEREAKISAAYRV